MCTFLEKFYWGEILPHEFPYAGDEQHQKLADRFTACSECFAKKLDEPLSKEFDKVLDAYSDLSIRETVLTFCYAYRLGAQVMIDVLQKPE